MTPEEQAQVEAEAEFSCAIFTEMVKELRRNGLRRESVGIPMLSIACDVAATAGMKRERFHRMVDEYFDAVAEREGKIARKVAS